MRQRQSQIAEIWPVISNVMPLSKFSPSSSDVTTYTEFGKRRRSPSAIGCLSQSMKFID